MGSGARGPIDPRRPLSHYGTMSKVGEESSGTSHKDGAPADVTTDARVRSGPSAPLSLSPSTISLAVPSDESTPSASDPPRPESEVPTPSPGQPLDGPKGAAQATEPAGEVVDPRIGASFGKYRVTRRLGRGGMGTVYLGEDTVLKRSVAIKFLPDDMVNKPEVVDRFLREAQVAGRLNHPNIIAIHDVAKDKQGCYMVMELLDPSSARSRMLKGPYPWQVATRIIADCCAALTMAHTAGVIHRDIKPDNILFTPTGVVKLVDFGLVKLLEDDMNLTQTGMLCGTPLYMSPEQASNEQMDVRSDLYSLGVTYFAMLTGRPPFIGPGVPQILLSHVRTPTPDPRTLAPGIPEECVRVLMRAMEKDRERRYQSAAEMEADLEAILSGVAHRNSSVFAMEKGFEMGAESPSVAHTKSLLVSPSRILSVTDAPAAAAPSSAMSRRGLLALAGLGVVGIGAGVWYRQSNRNTPGVLPRPVAPIKVEGITGNLPPLRVGILHSLTGSLAVTEGPMADASMLAVEEINSQGGLLGRQLVPSKVDGKSEVAPNSAFTRGAEQLLTKDHAAVVFGGFGSASRKSIQPFFEANNRLLFYPAQYEGLEVSQNIIYTGATPNQMVIPSIHWAIEELKATRFFFVGTDGLRARAINAIAEDTLTDLGGEVVGTDYALVGESQFIHTVKKIKRAKPQLIINDLVGDSSVSFFRELADAGITAEVIPTLSFTLGENELAQLGSLSLAGHYLARTRFPYSTPDAGERLAQHFRKLYGDDRVVSELMESAYYGVLLWAAAVRRAGTEDIAQVRTALLEKEFNLEGVRLRLDPSTQHAYKIFQLARITQKNTIEVIKTGDKPIRPIPFPPPRTPTEWKNFSEQLYHKWNDNWSNPQKPQLKKGK